MNRDDASVLDSLPQHVLERRPQAREFGAGERAGGSIGMDAVYEECLDAVDIADSAQDRLVEQRGRDRDRATAQARPGALGIGVLGQQIGPQAIHQALVRSVVEQLAGRGADQVDGDRVTDHTQLH